MKYALLKTDLTIDKLTPVTQAKLTLSQAFTELLNGTYLVLTGYEESTGADVFTRLNLAMNTPVTEISYKAPNSTSAWLRFPIPVNAFSLYDCYTYDENLYGNVLLHVGDIVRYNSQGVQVAVVSGVYTDANKVVYYTMQGDTTIYSLVAIPDPTIIDSTTTQLANVLEPVADANADYHQVAVEDYQNKIFVLL